jgi:energy-coupling factor transporter ATP-binding protein EcfA2
VIKFQRAVRRQHKLRLVLSGPTGSGKTKLSLLIAGAMAERVAVIDAESGSSQLCVGEPGVPDFDLVVLEAFSPRAYVHAIREAERKGYDFIVVDGLSPAWSGKDGALEMVDKAPKRWLEVQPQHNALIDTLKQCSAHLICTLRTKMEHVLEEDGGRHLTRKYGLAPVQQAGIEYEFDVVGELDTSHTLRITASRCSFLDGEVADHPGPEIGEVLLAWLNEGAPSLKEPRRDEYGLLVPRSPCPVVREGKPHAGVRWSGLEPQVLARMFQRAGNVMTPDQLDWAEYLIAYAKKREAFVAKTVTAALPAKSEAVVEESSAPQESRVERDVTEERRAAT